MFAAVQINLSSVQIEQQHVKTFSLISIFVICWKDSDFHWYCLTAQGSPTVMQHVLVCFFIVLNRDLFVYRDDSLTF